MQPTHADALGSRCGAKVLTGQVKAALEDCNKALRINPGDAKTLDSRGLIYLKQGQLAEAIVDYDAALKINPKLPLALFGRGMANLMKGNTTAKQLKPGVAEEFALYGLKMPDR